MNHKIIPYGKQKITTEDIIEVIKVLKSEYITQGPIIEIFENKISSIVGSEYGIAVNSATSALHLACLAIGLKKGDIVWTTPITFVASANCAIYCGASVDFVDIERETGLMCHKKLEEKLEKTSKEGKLPKIVIPVHLAGASCEMREIYELSIKYGFKIIEDASHAIGGEYENKKVGNCEFSDITVFSFHPVKIITSGEGGVATTNNCKLAESMRKLRSHGIERDKKKFIYESIGPWSYEQQELGFNYRMNEIQAALGMSQAKRLNKIIEKRERIRKKYEEEIQHMDVDLLRIKSNVKSSNHLVVIRLRNEGQAIHLNLFNWLRENGIGVQVHYSPVHLQPFYKKLGYKEGDYKESEDYGKSAISLPIYPELNNRQLKYIIEVLKIGLQK